MSDRKGRRLMALRWWNILSMYSSEVYREEFCKKKRAVRSVT